MSSSPHALALSLCLVTGCGTVLGLDEYRHEDPSPDSPSAIDFPCHEGEVLADDRRCLPVGVQPKQCTNGLSPDPAGGCSVTIPETDCERGLSQLGARGCDETFALGSCAPDSDGFPTPGAIPLGRVLFVDSPAAPGGDGKRATPLSTIGEALDRASTLGQGPVYLFVRGNFAEDVAITRADVTLQGCPGHATIVGQALTQPATAPCYPIGVESLGDDYWPAATVCVAPSADRATLDGLTIQGPSDGIQVWGATQLAVRNVGLNHLGKFGMRISESKVRGSSAILAADVALERTAISTVHGVGIQAIGSTLAVTNSSIQGVLPLNSWDDDPRRRDSGLPIPEFDKVGVARGIAIQSGYWTTDGKSAPESFASGTLSLSQTLITGVAGTAVLVSGAQADLDHVYVGSAAQGAPAGRGIAVERSIPVGKPARLTLSSSVIERTADAAIDVRDATVEISTTTIRDTRGRAGDGCTGQGIRVRSLPPGNARSSVTVRDSTILGSRQSAIFVAASDIEVESSFISHVEPDTVSACSGAMGDGLSLEPYPGQQPPTATLTNVLIDRASRAAIVVGGGTVSTKSVVASCSGRGMVDARGDGPSRDVPGAVCGCDASFSACRLEPHTLPSWVASGPSRIWPDMRSDLWSCVLVSSSKPPVPVPDTAIWAFDRPEVVPVSSGPDGCFRLGAPQTPFRLTVFKPGWNATRFVVSYSHPVEYVDLPLYSLDLVVGRHFPVGTPLLNFVVPHGSRIDTEPPLVLLDWGTNRVQGDRVANCDPAPCTEANRLVGVFMPATEGGWYTMENRDVTCSGSGGIYQLGATVASGNLRFQHIDYGASGSTDFGGCSLSVP